MPCSSAGTRSAARGSAARRAPPRSRRHPRAARRQVRHLGGRVVHGPVDRAHLREAAQDVDEVVALEALARRGDELDERLAGVAALAHDQVAKVARCRLLAVGLEPLRARPVAHGVADRVAEVGRQPAALDLEHLVPAARPVEAERGAAGRGRERVVELVAVVEDALGREDRLERRLRNAAEPAQRVARPAPPWPRPAPRRRGPGSGSRRTRGSARRAPRRAAGPARRPRARAPRRGSASPSSRARARVSPGRPRRTKTTKPFRRATPLPP